MIVRSEALWVAQTNTYVVAAEAGGPAVVVDVPPGLDGVSDLLAADDLTPVAILLTHGHVDHMGGAGSLAGRAEISAYVHPDDDFLTLDPSSQLELLFGVRVPGDFAPLDQRVAIEDGEVLDLAGLELTVAHTPGHSPGHCCFLVRGEGILFSGDQLFAGSVGRTDLPGGDPDALGRSMREKVMTLDDETRVLPGHGPETTVGRERASNPFRGLWS